MIAVALENAVVGLCQRSSADIYAERFILCFGLEYLAEQFALYALSVVQDIVCVGLEVTEYRRVCCPVNIVERVGDVAVSCSLDGWEGFGGACVEDEVLLCVYGMHSDRVALLESYSEPVRAGVGIIFKLFLGVACLDFADYSALYARNIEISHIKLAAVFEGVDGVHRVRLERFCIGCGSVGIERLYGDVEALAVVGVGVSLGFVNLAERQIAVRTAVCPFGQFGDSVVVAVEFHHISDINA